MDRDARTECVKGIAKELEFDFAGICSADSAPNDRGHLIRWLDQGFAGDMAYLARDPDRRSDPRRILPQARSIIVLGINYFPGRPGPAGQALRGRVAKYAVGKDYHKVLDKKLRRFIRKLESALGAPFSVKTYVDTGPLMERPFAQRAGIGFTGKNTLTLSRKSGSWIFLSELITDLDLRSDRPDPRDCGTCRMCLDACPTDAFQAPYVLDATKCISYLTIEHKGPIASPLRSRMGEWIFGCDVCQDVCPINHDAETSRAEDFLPMPAGGRARDDCFVDLDEVLRIRDRDRFIECFKGTPLTRPKREGLLRNACVAAGNLKDERLIPALTDALRTDSSPVVRGHAAWALGEIAAREAQDVLRSSRALETDSTVRAEIDAAMETGSYAGR